MIISRFPSGTASSGVPQFTYTGRYALVNDAGGWRIKFFSSGTLRMLNSSAVDVFLVGGGGYGSTYNKRESSESDQGKPLIWYRYGAGGGAGYTLTQKNLTLVSGNEYTVVVGASGEASSITPVDSTEWDGSSYTANGGASPSNGATSKGGDGGSGGAGSGDYMTYTNGAYYAGSKTNSGGTNGANGKKDVGNGGTGQGTTTREFGEESGDLYAAGGASCYFSQDAVMPPENTGNGGIGGMGYPGASGIVIIRNTRA